MLYVNIYTPSPGYSRYHLQWAAISFHFFSNLGIFFEKPQSDQIVTMLIYPHDANKRHKQNCIHRFIHQEYRTDRDMVELIIIYILCVCVDRMRER